MFITNKIIKFLGNECSRRPLCFRSGIFVRPALLFSHHPGPAVFPTTLRAEAEHWDGRNHSWGSYSKGRKKMVCWGRGPVSHHTLLPFTRRGERRSNRTGKQEAFAQRIYMSINEDRFQGNNEIHVRGSRTEMILFSHSPEGILSSTFPQKMYPLLQTWGSWLRLIFLPRLTGRSWHNGLFSSDLNRGSSCPLLLDGLFFCLLMGTAARSQESNQAGI